MNKAQYSNRVDRDAKKEKLKDNIMRNQTEYNYVKVVNKDYSIFLNFLMKLKNNSGNVEEKKEKFTPIIDISEAINIAKYKMNQKVLNEKSNLLDENYFSSKEDINLLDGKEYYYVTTNKLSNLKHTVDEDLTYPNLKNAIQNSYKLSDFVKQEIEKDNESCSTKCYVYSIKENNKLELIGIIKVNISNISNNWRDNIEYEWLDNIKEDVNMLNENNIPFKLYHASKYLFDELRPFGIDFGNSLQDIGWSLFTWTKYKSAMGWGCWEVIRHLNKIDENIIINGCINSQTTVLWETTYNYLKENIYKYSEEDLTFYIYTIPTKTEFEYGLGHSSNTPNCITIRNDHIKYSKVEKYILNIDMIDNYCKVFPDGYEPTKKECGLNKRLTSFLMKYDFMYQPKLRKTIKKAIENGELNVGDDIYSFLKDNNIDMKSITFKERIKDIFTENTLLERELRIDDRFTHSHKWVDVLNIFSSMNNKDKGYINNTFKYTDSNAKIYRDVILINGEPASFVEVTDLYKVSGLNEDKGLGHVTVCTKDKFRGNKLSELLCKEMIENLAFDRSKGIAKLRWRCKQENESSIKLALKLGFIFDSTTNDGKNIYYLDLSTIKNREITL